MYSWERDLRAAYKEHARLCADADELLYAAVLNAQIDHGIGWMRLGQALGMPTSTARRWYASLRGRIEARG